MNSQLPAPPTIGDDQPIRAAVVRLEAALERKPSFGHATLTSTTTLVDGLRCRSEEAGQVIDSDLPAALGGNTTAPTPGALLRAALGSCLAMGYRLRAARLGIAVQAISVVVETDSTIEGMIRTGSTEPPGFTAIRCHVAIESSSPTDMVMAMIEEGDELSPILDAVTGVNQVTRSVSIVGGSG